MSIDAMRATCVRCGERIVHQSHDRDFCSDACEREQRDIDDGACPDCGRVFGVGAAWNGECRRGEGVV